MAFPRVTFFIQDARFSWTETYYAVDQNVSLDTLIANAGNLAVLRTQLMANYIEDPTGKTGVSLSEIRVSMDDTWRDSLVDYRYARNGSKAVYPKGAAFVARPERPYSVILLRMDASQGGAPGQYRKVMYLSGVPENVVGDPNAANIATNPAWWLSLSLFVNALSSKPAVWGFKVRLKGLASPESSITDVKSPPNVAQTQIFAPGTNWNQLDVNNNQQYLLIRNCRFDPPERGCNGMQRFLNVPAVPPAAGNTPGTYLLPDVGGTGVYKGKGVVRILKYGIVAIDDCVATVETRHKRGGRTGLPLGRSKKSATSG